MSEAAKIRVRLLGTAAGGGLPQWNCACANCAAARRGDIPPRTQSSVGLEWGDQRWFLVNASPDLRAQVEAFPAIQPTGVGTRDTPLGNVLLTNADLDHVLGLFLLRESRQPLRVHCTAAVRDTLHGDLRMDDLLAGYCRVEWHELTEMNAPLATAGAAASVSVRAIPLPGEPPRYAGHGRPNPGQSVALEFVHLTRGKRIVLAPDVAGLTPALLEALEGADLVIFDGTFWSDDELRLVEPAARTASQMGHLPISSGSLALLRELRDTTRVYVHINNTNPVLAPGSAARAEVLAAGILVGEDGMGFEL